MTTEPDTIPCHGCAAPCEAGELENGFCHLCVDWNEGLADEYEASFPDAGVND